MAEKEIRLAKNKLRKFKNYDDHLEKLSFEKNNLESLIYKVQDLLSQDSFVSVITSEDENTLKTLTIEYDEWLFSEEADTASLKEIKSKHRNLFSIVEGANIRQSEY